MTVLGWRLQLRRRSNAAAVVVDDDLLEEDGGSIFFFFEDDYCYRLYFLLAALSGAMNITRD